jgi:MFS family permease
VLLYPAYTLLFTDHGLSAWQLSSLLVIWSATGILFEVPSGALADAYSRRALLVIGPLLTAAGYALWVFAPSYPAFAAGFVLWGVKGALASGALEALVYEELDRQAAAEAYPKLTGRAQTFGVVAVLVATAVASPVLAAGGYPAIGVASVAACVLTAAVAATFPEHRWAPERDTEEPELGYLATLRAGLAEARTQPRVRTWLLVVPAITAGWGALEEYAPLLIRETGVATAHVPLYYLLIWGGVSVGGLFAAAGNRLSGRGLATLLAAAGLAMAGGALSGRPAGIAVVAAAFAAFQVATVVADARLQNSITGPGRATVTSVASLATDGVTILVYAAYAALAPAGHGTAFAVLAVPYLVVAVGLARFASHEPAARRVYLMTEKLEPGDGS